MASNGEFDEPLSVFKIDRRALLKGAAGLIGTGAAMSMLGQSSAHARGGALAEIKPSVVAGDDDAIVSTVSGPVAGYIRNGIFTFKGIPYGDTTEGANRFMPPVKPKPWTAVRSSRQYGNIAPQLARNSSGGNDEEAFMFDWDDTVTRVYRAAAGENCLRVNVWTPSISKGSSRRPVMVWLHGGGFANGSGNEQPAYDGENLARSGDVVVVTLNHRLNVLGYLNLAKYGDKYASSGNAGMLDIVAALEWVRDNIAEFGGDPGCVTIFGQSGGGSKVSTLMGMPSAKGLFHRAIVQSGSMLKAGSIERSSILTDLIVARLGLTPATIDQIQTVPWEQLLQAADEAMSRYNAGKDTPLLSPLLQKGGDRNSDGAPVDRLGFGPIVDGVVLPDHPFSPVASALSVDVPMMVGTTLNEFVNGINQPNALAMTDAELEEKARAAYKDKAPSILAAFRKRTPNALPFDIWSRISASNMRGNAVKQCRAKSAIGGAPAYLYWFAWYTPIFGGRPRAFHCSELPFVFDNAERCDTMTGAGAEARKLASRMSRAWVSFARSGDPNHSDLPHWAAFTPGDAPTMIFDNVCVAEDYPDREEQASVGNA